MSDNKVKVMKTNRIRLHNATIYCSCEIISRVKEHLVRMEQNIHAPAKGQYWPLLTELRTLTRSKPNHFPKSSIDIIG